MPDRLTALQSLRLALPKGRMQQGIFDLLAAAGIPVRGGSRHYRPQIALDQVEAKLLKPQAVVRMLASGSRDLGFTGADWVAELGAEVVELADTGLDPVAIVAAAPAAQVPPGCDLETWMQAAAVPAQPVPNIATNHPRIATEYPRMMKAWLGERGLQAQIITSQGATEVYPPEDADLIVDNTATGATLRANGLAVVETISTSTTRLYASREAMDDQARRLRIEEFQLLIESVLEARRRVVLEVNVDGTRLDDVIAGLPCLREPTVSPLHGRAGFAVKAAVPRELLASLIPELRRRGATDLLVSDLAQLVP